MRAYARASVSLATINFVYVRATVQRPRRRRGRREDEEEDEEEEEEEERRIRWTIRQPRVNVCAGACNIN